MRQATRRGYTLIELMIVVTIMGIAAAMVIPSMGQSDTLRVQGAVRSIVSDLAFAQADAIAFQEPRAVIFNALTNEYRVLAPTTGAVLETETLELPSGPNGEYIVSLNAQMFAGSTIESPSFGGNASVVFDALGTPVISPTSSTPSSGGTVDIVGSDSRYRVTVEAFTGRVRVERIEIP